MHWRWNRRPLSRKIAAFPACGMSPVLFFRVADSFSGALHMHEALLAVGPQAARRILVLLR